MINKVESLPVSWVRKYLAALKIAKNLHLNACSGEKVNKVKSFRFRF